MLSALGVTALWFFSMCLILVFPLLYPTWGWCFFIVFSYAWPTLAGRKCENYRNCSLCWRKVPRILLNLTPLFAAVPAGMFPVTHCKDQGILTQQAMGTGRTAGLAPFPFESDQLSPLIWFRVTSGPSLQYINRRIWFWCRWISSSSHFFSPLFSLVRWFVLQGKLVLKLSLFTWNASALWSRLWKHKQNEIAHKAEVERLFLRSRLLGSLCIGMQNECPKFNTH